MELRPGNSMTGIWRWTREWNTAKVSSALSRASLTLSGQRSGLPWIVSRAQPSHYRIPRRSRPPCQLTKLDQESYESLTSTVSLGERMRLAKAMTLRAHSNRTQRIYNPSRMVMTSRHIAPTPLS